MKNKITTTFLRDVIRQYDREEISLSRAAEILNEKVAQYDALSELTEKGDYDNAVLQVMNALRVYATDGFDQALKLFPEFRPFFIRMEEQYEKKKGITGEDVAALLHGIHDHVELLVPRWIIDRVEDDLDDHDTKALERVVYTEEDLIPVLEALGLPAPVWGKSMSVEQWKKQRSEP